MLNQNEIDDLFSDIYEGRTSTFDLPYPVFEDAYNTLANGLVSGFGAYKFESPAHDLIQHLDQNIYMFSGAKTYKEIYCYIKIISKYYTNKIFIIIRKVILKT